MNDQYEKALYNSFRENATNGKMDGYVGMINMGQKYEHHRLKSTEKLFLFNEEQVRKLHPEKYINHFYLGRCCQYLLEKLDDFVVSDNVNIIELAENIHLKNWLNEEFSNVVFTFDGCDCGKIPIGLSFFHKYCQCGKYIVEIITSEFLHLDAEELNLNLRLTPRD